MHNMVPIANNTDIKDTIEALNIPNITVEVLGDGRLKLTEANGNAVIITQCNQMMLTVMFLLEEMLV